MMINKPDFFKKDPLEKEDKIKLENIDIDEIEYVNDIETDTEENIDDPIAEYNELNSSISEGDSDKDLFGDSLLKNVKPEIIADGEQETTFDSELDEDIKIVEDPEISIAPEHCSEPEEEPQLQHAIKKADDFNPENKGEILKRERLKKGLSLEFIHEVTKVPMDVLRAIEEGYSVRTLSPFYLKGFTKIYAKYLEVDTDRVIDDYKREKLPEHVKYEANDFDFNKWLSKIFTKKRKQQIVIGLGLLLILFTIFKIATFIANLKPKQKVIKIDKVNTETKVIVVPEKKITVRKPKEEVKQTIIPIKEEKKEVKVIAEKKSEEVVKKKEAEKQALIKNVAEKKVVETAKTIPAVTPPQNVVPKAVSAVKTEVPVQKNVSLTVRAKKNSWLSVKVDGNVVFQSTLKLGSVETWMADESIEISGKNINQLDFELNGKMIRSLGRKDSKAKRLIVTKEGLTVTN